MKRLKLAHLVTAACALFVIAGCHNTAQGVKADTRRALEKIDHKLDKDGDKTDQHARK